MNYTILDEIQTICVASNLRKAYKAVQRIYEEAYRDAPVTPVQFSVLVTISRHASINAGNLAAFLGSDLSTISRNIKVLEKRKLVRCCAGEDRRRRQYYLTDSGDAAVQAAIPCWREAHEKSVAKIGVDLWDQLRPGIERLAEEAEIA
ncbi:MAG: MarR family winged helix-turn-helix transcriptional regulator [Spirochaeta sp.]|nr:MarR family winged helix-turn-helix transcriptional regulator [Spirochaeta sp.]